MRNQSIRFLKILVPILTGAVMVMAFFAHPEGSPLRPYLYATIAPWMAAMLLQGWLTRIRRDPEQRM